MVGRQGTPRTADAKVTRTLPGIIGILLALALFGWQGSRRDASYARAESRRLASVVDSLERVKTRVDTVHAVTVRTVVRQVTRLDTLTQTVDRWKSDTIRVVEYVTRADSLARACTALIESCEAKVNARDALLTTQGQKFRADLAIVQAKVPTLRDRLQSTALTIVFWEGGKALLRAAAP